MKREEGREDDPSASPRSAVDAATPKTLNSKLGPRAEGSGSVKLRLESLFEEATVDAFGEAEQAGGFFAMIEDNLRAPFTTEVRGFEVTVTRIDMTEADEIVAICGRGGESQRISILELPLPFPVPEGSEWLAAERELGKLRSLSTRAEITPTSFVNSYNWAISRAIPTP